MVHYRASEAQRQFSKLLDAAERGEEVMIGRRGVYFRLILEPSNTQNTPFILEEDVLSGNWTWAADEAGQLHFKVTT